MCVVVIDVDREGNAIKKKMGRKRDIKFNKYAKIHDLLSSFWKRIMKKVITNSIKNPVIC
jgi:hypothetical protein